VRTILRSQKTKQAEKTITGDRKDIADLTGAVRKSVVCVSRLAPDTTIDAVESYLHKKDIQTFSCFLVKRADSGKPNQLNDGETRNLRYRSMRVCVPHYSLDKILSADFWPAGVVVRPWRFKQNASVACRC